VLLLLVGIRTAWRRFTNSPSEKNKGRKEKPEMGKSTTGGWGRVIPSGDKDHITATYDKAGADVGDGFHITSDGSRTYFDNQGRCLGSGRQIAKLLKKLNAQRKRGVISEEDYAKAIDSLAARNA